jgi:uncharacterized protein YbjQ (UPF0145 family)
MKSAALLFIADVLTLGISRIIRIRAERARALAEERAEAIRRLRERAEDGKADGGAETNRRDS